MMDIDEAIKNLQARIDGEFYLKEDGKDDCADMKLGIEALKLVKKCRDDDQEIIDLPMPGETEK